MEQGPDVARVKREPFARGVEKAADLPMLDHHAFRAPRRTRCVDAIGRVRWRCSVIDAVLDIARSFRLDIAQNVPPTPGQPNKEPMLIPLVLGLVGRGGADLPLMLEGKPLARGVIELTEPRQSFVFTNVVERPVLSLNRGFSAPVKLTMPIDPEHLCFLAAHDCDPFNRWQAIQTSAMTLLKNNVAAIRSGDGPGLADEGLMDALGATLNGPALEPAFVALALSPPSEPDIAREIGHDVDPDAVFAARRKLRATAGSFRCPRVTKPCR